MDFSSMDFSSMNFSSINFSIILFPHSTIAAVAYATLRVRVKTYTQIVKKLLNCQIANG